MIDILAATAVIGFIIHNVNKLHKRAKLAEQKYSDSVQNYSKLLSQKKSSEVKTGHIAEKLAPFLSEFPKHTSTADIVPLFAPIDYVVFDEDIVKFVEVKSGDSRLSAKQRRIKKLIIDGKVEWHEMRIK